MIDLDVWNDQKEFNSQLRDLPQGEPERTALIKEFTLHQMTEMAEFLNAAGAFGTHRRLDDPPLVNGENIRRQLIDQLKYWMSICQAFGFTPEQMTETYWRKSVAVRQRHAEEWLTDLDSSVVLLDMDGVLCDYLVGLGRFLQEEGRELGFHFSSEHWDRIVKERLFVNADTLGVSLKDWNWINHEFRAEGGFRSLPLLPHAQKLVWFCREVLNAHTVIMTSRPIEQYPNIYDDTVAWLKNNNLHADKIWWGPNKAEKLTAVREHIHSNILFAVDDDPRYVEQFAQAGVERVYWYRHGYPTEPDMQKYPGIVPITGLKDIIDKERITT